MEDRPLNIGQVEMAEEAYRRVPQNGHGARLVAGSNSGAVLIVGHIPDVMQAPCFNLPMSSHQGADAMRPLFNVPGIGSFVVSMGLATGYPMDAVLTAKFCKQGLCTKVEGERLLAFTNSTEPLLNR